MPDDTGGFTRITATPADTGGFERLPTKSGGQGGGDAGVTWAGALWRGLAQGFQVPELPLMPGAQANREKVQADVQAQYDQAKKAHPAVAIGGNVVGNIAATVPMMGGGAGATLPARIAAGAPAAARAVGATLPTRLGLGALRGGAAGAMGAEPQPGTGGGSYFAEKAKQLGIGMAVGGAIPAAGAALAPAMPNVSQFAANVGKAFPSLRNFLFGAEERTVDGFNRSVARQVLEPIGGDVPRKMKAGHDLVDHTYQQLDRAYDEIKPSLSLNQNMGAGAWRTYQPELDRIKGELASGDWQNAFDKFIENRITNRFDKNGIMDGDAFKVAEHDLTKRINTLHGTNNAELGEALSEVRDLFRDALLKQNPAQAPQLGRINDAYSMFYRMSRAASGKSAEGKFTPSDLQGAIRQQEKNPHAYARGKAMAGGPALPDGRSTLQAYATLGDKLLKGARVGPMDLVHAFHPSGMIPAAAKAVVRGGGVVGRGIKGSAPVTSPLAGRAAAAAEESRQTRPRHKTEPPP